MLSCLKKQARSERKTRDYALDNIRFFLIFCVVFAHLLEICRPFSGRLLAYAIINTFTMPAFVFLFGYNIKYNPKRILYRWCVPYVIFQGLFIFFARFILGTNTRIQFTTPYWLLWYMLVCILYQLILPLYSHNSKRGQLLFVALAFMAALLVGFDKSVGYYLSLSRFVVFLPWFLLGVYCKKHMVLERIAACVKLRVGIAVAAIAIMALSVPFLYVAKLPNGLLYGSCSYSQCNGAVWMRAEVALIAAAWLFFLFLGVKPMVNKRIPVITTIGQNTWPVFLLHGFIVKAISVYMKDLLYAPWVVLLVTGVILVLTGNRLFGKIVYYISFSWLEKRSADNAMDENRDV